MDCSQPGSSVHGILRARMLELFPSPDDLPNPGIKPMSPALQVDSLLTELPGKPINIGLSCHALLQGIFPTQGSNPGLPHYRQILYSLSHQGSPRILEWVAYPFSRRFSQPRNWTRVSCIARRFFTTWATRQVPHSYLICKRKESLLIYFIPVTTLSMEKYIGFWTHWCLQIYYQRVKLLKVYHILGIGNKEHHGPSCLPYAASQTGRWILYKSL